MLRKSIFAACLITAGLMSLPAQAQGPSFNCRLASRPDEVRICQSDRLSQLDRRMASLFDRARNRLYGGAQAALVREQTQWLRGRFGCGYDYGCIEGMYLSRIAELGG